MAHAVYGVLAAPAARDVRIGPPAWRRQQLPGRSGRRCPWSPVRPGRSRRPGGGAGRGGTDEGEACGRAAVVNAAAACRNTFAHSLTGSYWETDESIAAMFTTEAMEDSLYIVGAMAILIEEIVTARATKEENSE